MSLDVLLVISIERLGSLTVLPARVSTSPTMNCQMGWCMALEAMKNLDCAIRGKLGNSMKVVFKLLGSGTICVKTQRCIQLSKSVTI